MHTLERVELARRIEELIDIGTALSAEHDHPRLLEKILLGAKRLTNADGGSIYVLEQGRRLQLAIVRTDSLDYAMGGTTGNPVPFPPIELYQEDGTPHLDMVVTRAVLQGHTINVEDAYHNQEFDFSGTRAFDANTGYRSQSFLTVPLKNHEDETLGVLQLINALDPESGAVVPFSAEDERLVNALASQAAIAMSNHKLIDDLNRLLESLIHMVAAAIDQKSPYTGVHCRRVPAITMMLAEAVAGTKDGPLHDFRMDEQDRYELEIAAWLHDCGKIATPEYVIDKATKLECIHDRIHEIECRIQILKQEAEIRMLKALAEAQEEGVPERENELRRHYQRTLGELEDERQFLRRINHGAEFMSPEDQQRVRRIGRRSWTGPDGKSVPLLSDDEIHNLTIPKGTLTEDERGIINQHIDVTIRMLEALPFPKHLKRVPEFAGGHHERVDGRGYPKGLTRDQMSIQARIMAIADIFEALTAKDRPYKKGMPLSRALQILGRMKLDHHIDPDLFDVFVRDKVYMKYARRYLDSEQIDEVDETAIPGYSA